MYRETDYFLKARAECLLGRSLASRGWAQLGTVLFIGCQQKGYTMYLGATDPKVIARQKVEIKIVRAVIAALLRAGFSLTVFDGGEEHLLEIVTTEKHGTLFHGSKYPRLIEDAIYNTDEDYLNTYIGGKPTGWVRFIYGNDGWDVINDYTTNLEPFIGKGTEVERLIDKLEKGQYDITVQ